MEDELRSILMEHREKLVTTLKSRLNLDALPSRDDRNEAESVEDAWDAYQEENFRQPEPTDAEKSFADKMLFKYNYKDTKVKIEFLTKLFVLCKRRPPPF